MKNIPNIKNKMVNISAILKYLERKFMSWMVGHKILPRISHSEVKWENTNKVKIYRVQYTYNHSFRRMNNSKDWRILMNPKELLQKKNYSRCKG